MKIKKIKVTAFFLIFLLAPFFFVSAQISPGDVPSTPEEINSPTFDLEGIDLPVSNQGPDGLKASESGLSLPTEFGLPDAQEGIRGILINIANWLLSIIGVIAVIAFIISGLQYFFAAGDERKVETAKRNITYSIIGIIVALSGFVIIQAIDYALNAYTTTF